MFLSYLLYRHVRSPAKTLLYRSLSGFWCRLVGTVILSNVVDHHQDTWKLGTMSQRFCQRTISSNPHLQQSAVPWHIGPQLRYGVEAFYRL